MKEATGELNMTVITVVAIAAVAAFFYAFVWPSIRANITNSTKCASAINCRDCQNGKCTCDYIDGSKIDAVVCPDASAN
jgi:hypothetical protein